MSLYYFNVQTGQCLGSFGPGTELPPQAQPAPTAPLDGRQIWNGAAWEWPVPVLRERMIDAVATRYETALAAGLSYGGKILQIRAQDQVNLTTMGHEARWVKSAGNTWPSDFAWRMADDSFLPLPDADAMIALGEAAKAEVYRLRQVKWGHVDSLRALPTSAALAAYDIEMGWAS